MKIKEIVLQADSFDGIKEFYADLLELTILQADSHKISIAAGASVLTFILSKEYDSPYYHFAFNITGNKKDQALRWLKNKGVNINRINGQDHYYSESWNSHSIYFFDPLGNVVEFIARRSLFEDKQEEFGSEDIKNISEIGFPVEDVSKVSDFFQSNYYFEVYKSANDVFAPLGDEEGLFILSGLNRNWLGSNKQAKVFPVVVEIYSHVIRNENLLNYPYIIREVLSE